MRYKMLCLLLLFEVACQKAASEKETWALLEKDAAHESLVQGEDALKLADRYLKFSQEFPSSPNAPKALLKSAQLYDANRLTKTAIERYQEVARRFPKSAEAAQASFLIGFAYSNVLGDTVEARKAFEQFLRNYPESELVPSARLELTTMGKSLDDLFKPDSLASQ
ncbi:MAG: tetratricopeptide repeat protein [Chloroherpetonaceae bacterium]